ncbi:hypothetical protein FHR29_000053 [Sphingobacterium sp. JUb56]|nr:hypothetical protein [Sphingobacterium sp. JUb56]
MSFLELMNNSHSQNLNSTKSGGAIINKLAMFTETIKIAF